MQVDETMDLLRHHFFKTTLLWSNAFKNLMVKAHELSKKYVQAESFYVCKFGDPL